MGVFFKRSRAANSAVRGRILPNFDLVQVIMVVLHTCKNEENLIKNKYARMLTRLYVVFFRHSRAANSEVSSGILPKIGTHPSSLVVLHTRKNEEDPIKKEGVRVLTSLLFDFSDVRGQLTLKSVVEVRRNSNTSKLL